MSDATKGPHLGPQLANHNKNKTAGPYVAMVTFGQGHTRLGPHQGHIRVTSGSHQDQSRVVTGPQQARPISGQALSGPFLDYIKTTTTRATKKPGATLDYVSKDMAPVVGTGY